MQANSQLTRRKKMEQKIIKQIETLEQKLVQTDPLDESYSKLLTAIGQLALVAQQLSDLDIEECEEENDEEEENEFVEMKQVPVTKVEKIQQTLTYDEVRTICSEAMSRGVKVKDIIKKYSEEGKLTSVAEKDYEALVNEVKNA